MARKERDVASTKGKGATPRQEAKKRSVKLGVLFGWLTFDTPRFSVLKKVKWRFVLGATIAGLAIIFVSVYWDDAVNEFDHEITSIEVRGQVNYLKPKVLREQLDRHLGEGFISLNLGEVKESVESMPWVYSASLQRQWPGTLIVYVKEQYPVAVWNKNFYLNAYGEVFEPRDVFVIEGIPDLSGLLGQEKDVLQRYVNYRDRLADSGAILSELSLEPRGAWRIALRSGVSIKLGRDPADAKLDRFIKAYQQGLKGQVEEIESIDARYTNGIAVRWKEQTET